MHLQMKLLPDGPHCVMGDPIGVIWTAEEIYRSM